MGGPGQNYSSLSPKKGEQSYPLTWETFLVCCALCVDFVGKGGRNVGIVSCEDVISNREGSSSSEIQNPKCSGQSTYHIRPQTPI